MTHRVLSHTADTGVEATAASLPELLQELLAAMFGLMADVAGRRPERWVEADVESDTVGDLTVDTLSEALYLGEVEDLLLCDFEVTQRPGQPSVRIRMGGVPLDRIEATGPAIKAVTYYGLVVEERDPEWYGRVYFDV